MRMLNNVTTNAHHPHTLFDNQQTQYGPAPGPHASEIEELKKTPNYSLSCQYYHLMDVLDEALTSGGTTERWEKSLQTRSL